MSFYTSFLFVFFITYQCALAMESTEQSSGTGGTSASTDMSAFYDILESDSGGDTLSVTDTIDRLERINAALSRHEFRGLQRAFSGANATEMGDPVNLIESTFVKLSRAREARISRLMQYASEENPIALTWMGCYYLQHATLIDSQEINTIRQSYIDLALENFFKAISQNHLPAYVQMGKYYTGLGNDFELAYEYFLPAYQQDNTDAAVELAVMAVSNQHPEIDEIDMEDMVRIYLERAHAGRHPLGTFYRALYTLMMDRANEESRLRGRLQVVDAIRFGFGPYLYNFWLTQFMVGGTIGMTRTYWVGTEEFDISENFLITSILHPLIISGHQGALNDWAALKCISFPCPQETMAIIPTIDLSIHRERDLLQELVRIMTSAKPYADFFTTHAGIAMAMRVDRPFILSHIDGPIEALSSPGAFNAPLLKVIERYVYAMMRYEQLGKEHEGPYTNYDTIFKDPYMAQWFVRLDQIDRSEEPQWDELKETLKGYLNVGNGIVVEPNVEPIVQPDVEPTGDIIVEPNIEANIEPTENIIVQDNVEPVIALNNPFYAVDIIRHDDESNDGSQSVTEDSFSDVEDSVSEEEGDGDIRESKRNIGVWIDHLRSEPEEDQPIIWHRAKRLRDYITQLSILERAAAVGILAHEGGETCDQRALTALTKYENLWLRGNAINVESLPIQLSSIIGSDKIEKIMNLCKLAGHLDEVEESRYYLILMQHIIDLPTHETRLNYAYKADGCLKLSIALQNVLRSLSRENMIRITYDFLRHKPMLVAGWLANEPDFIDRNQMDVWGHFATEDMLEVKREAISDILLRLGWLSARLDY